MPIDLIIFLCFHEGVAYLDNDDLNAIRRIFEDALDKKFDEKLGFKLDKLPTRDELYERIEKILEILHSATLSASV